MSLLEVQAKKLDKKWLSEVTSCIHRGDFKQRLEGKKRKTGERWRTGRKEKKDWKKEKRNK